MGKKYGSNDQQYGLSAYLGDSWGKSTKTAKPRCYTKHPVLKLGGGEILGASCHHPPPVGTHEY